MIDHRYHHHKLDNALEAITPVLLGGNGSTQVHWKSIQPFDTCHMITVFKSQLTYIIFVFCLKCLLSTVLMLSGNHGFYTLLVMTLSLCLLDDDWLKTFTGGPSG